MTTPDLPLWRNRDYRLWWLGNLVSAVGSQMSTLAYPLLVLVITGSPLTTGVAAALEVVPYVVLSLPVGVLADRISRRRLLASAALVNMATTATIPLLYGLGELRIGAIFAVAVVNGMASVVYTVTEVAVLPRLVGSAQMDGATAQFEATWGVSTVIGPPLAGILVSEVWPAAPFVVDAATFAMAAGCVLALRSALGPEPPQPNVVWRRDLQVGAQIFWARRTLRSLTLLSVGGDCLFAGIYLLMVVLVRSAGGSGTAIGAVFAAAAVGGTVGSAAANWLRRRVGLVTAVVAKHWLTALLFVPLAFRLPPAGVGAVWAVVAFLVSVLNVVQMRYLLGAVGGDVLGRAQSFLTFLSYGSLPIGVAVTGLALQQLGPTATVIAYCVALGLLAVYSSVSRDLRAAPSTADAPPLMAEAGS